ncbi:MAG: BREX system Lon protease-like protein BrxL [Thermoguttaceae bacterium]|nr:BREX system Lon protease-like protein BrxL [Thermoguttaceae bacterium]
MKTELDNKILKYFTGCVVRKDLVKEVKGNSIVPTYVLEYLLGQYCPTDDEATIDAGIEAVKDILKEHFVHRSEAELVKHKIHSSRRHKVIDMISVTLNDRENVYEARFANLGISKVVISPSDVKTHEKLLVNGVWCIATLSYMEVSDTTSSPWILESIKPIQLSHLDFDTFAQQRQNFTTEEWIDLLIQSIGFNPAELGWRNKMYQLMRLVPYCENNYNLIELGPKGTGKSHIYSEFSPHGILLSGGEVTVPKLFVNNASGRIGLVGYWDAIAFDEFAGKQKKPEKSLVDIMKNYMANKSFSRGVDVVTASASMAFVGNTAHTVPFMLKNSDLFDELPKAYHDSAFLDRIHFYIPGWEVDIIRGEMFSQGFGFVVDYLAEILRELRKEDFSDDFKKFFTLSPKISTRDRDAICKTMSGLMKLLYPNGSAPVEEVKKLLEFAMEGRKRVKDQIMRFDNTFDPTDFYFEDSQGTRYQIKTLEEITYPKLYDVNLTASEEEANEEPDAQPSAASSNAAVAVPEPPALQPGHRVFVENQTGVCYEDLFLPYLKGAVKIEITDPYLRQYYQMRNLLDLVMLIIHNKSDAPIEIDVITVPDDVNEHNQRVWLDQITENCKAADVHFDWKFADPNSIHARHIITDTGWKIILDRGLDIFQRFDTSDAFSLAINLQEYRLCKPFEITYMRLED